MLVLRNEGYNNSIVFSIGVRDSYKGLSVELDLLNSLGGWQYYCSQYCPFDRAYCFPNQDAPDFFSPHVARWRSSPEPAAHRTAHRLARVCASCILRSATFAGAVPDFFTQFVPSLSLTSPVLLSIPLHAFPVAW
jgi:hypothetical protein